jgi:hypothetical protein
MSMDKVLIGLQSVGGLIGGAQQQGQYRRQGAVLDENARLTELQGNLDASEAARASRREEGEIAAALAGMGTMGGTGSSEDIMYQTALEREYELMNIRFGAAQEAAALRTQARQARSAGKAALVNGVLGAATSAIAGVRDLKNDKQARADLERIRSAQLPGRIPVPRRLQGGSFMPPTEGSDPNARRRGPFDIIRY